MPSAASFAISTPAATMFFGIARALRTQSHTHSQHAQERVLCGVVSLGARLLLSLSPSLGGKAVRPLPPDEMAASPPGQLPR